jgi:hypothetical protein
LVTGKVASAFAPSRMLGVFRSLSQFACGAFL